MKAVVGMSDWEGKGRPIEGPAVGLLLNRRMNIKCLGLLLLSHAPGELWVHIPYTIHHYLSCTLKHGFLLKRSLSED